MNFNLKSHGYFALATPHYGEVIRMVLKILALLLPAVACWTWQTTHLDTQAQPLALACVAALTTLGAAVLLIFRDWGLSVEGAGLLGTALLGWIMGIAAWGGQSKLELLMIFIGVLAVALAGGLIVCARALAASHEALAQAQKALMAASVAHANQLKSLFKSRESLLLDLAAGLATPIGEPFPRAAARYLATAMNADLVMVAELGTDARLSTLALWKDQLQVPDTSFESGRAPFDAVLGSAELVELNAPDGLPCPDSAGWPGGPDDIFRSCAALALRDADGTPIGLLWASWRAATVATREQTSIFQIVANRSASELIRLRQDREIFQLKESLEHRVLARTERLRATNAELKSFAYSVSHDLQSPLRSIQGFLFLLERRLKPRLSAEEDRLFERVRANVLRMHELINDLLALARVSRSNLVRESVNLSKMAEHVLNDLQIAAPEREVHLKITPDLHASCDAKLALIVMENLLGNAFKYTRKKKVAHIEFRALPVASSASTTFFVRDNGAGFNMEYLGSLFKPFSRLHHDDEYEGSGIGLATVHRILDRHGGSIRVEAVEGQGACFYFTFEDDLTEDAPKTAET